MTIRKTPNGRWRAQLKSGRTQVASKTFDMRREAVAWLSRDGQRWLAEWIRAPVGSWSDMRCCDGWNRGG